MRHRRAAAVRLPFAVLVAALAAAIPVLPLSAQEAKPQAKKQLTLEQTAGRSGSVSYAPRAPSFRWGPERKLVRITETDGKKRVSRWFDPATMREVEAPPGAETGASRADALQEEGRRRMRRGRGGATRGGAPRVAQVRGGDLHFEGHGKVTDGGGVREAHASPSKKLASFVHHNDLAIYDSVHKAIWQVTDDGSDDVLNGVLDWVYQEELYGRGDFQAHWWSPDDAAVAFLRLDESNVKTFTVVDHVPTRNLSEERAVEPEVTNYPKAGDPNPTVRLAVARLAERDVVQVDLSDYDAQEFLIVRVGWTPRGDRVVFMVQDRIQTWVDLRYADPATGETRLLFRETSPTWVNRPRQPQYLKDGTFLWLSDRTGYRNIYHYEPDGRLIRAVTELPWPVGSILRVDEEQRRIWFTASGEQATSRHAFVVDLDDGPARQLTRDEGTHSIQLNHDGSAFVDRFSTHAQMPQVQVCSGDGEVLATFDSQPPAALAEYEFAPKELFTVDARDGFALDATLIRPTGFEPGGGPYPVFIDTYSGPNAPSARDTWSHSAWHQFLAQQGFLVLQVNVRSASGKGHVTTGTCYKQFGVQELKDLEDAIEHVCASHGGDPARVGIRGWSYGGFMAAYALTHSDKFALGIAGAGVYDWQLYDTIYTERYMDTPQRNPDGYARSSVLRAAKNLKGHLLIVHGTMDDNVHLQNAMRLCYELQMANQPFDLMLYPKSRHGLGAREQRWHLRQLEWRTIREVLGNGRRGV